MTAQLELEVAQYRQWRDELIGAIDAYQSWLDSTGQIDAQQTLQIYDLLDSLKKDRLVLAFVAEFSRGKTELINALFFSDFKQRLLPSDVGRTTMCPTEIFHDPEEEPYVRLLPIESRRSDQSIASLKRSPIQWTKMRLNLDSHQDMLTAMNAVAQVKLVAPEEARELGLWDDSDPSLRDLLRADGKVEIPAWRHALINYPHTLLQGGLVILDTPGLNALGAEPELTLNMIPNAHAVLFLLAMDTGVTKSDLDIWHKFIQKFVPHRLAVLNKVDVLWDDLKPWEQIEASIRRQIEATSRMLELPPDKVLAISAQKALLAKIRGDGELLRKSGIERLETLLATDVIPAKQHILREAALKEIGGMVEASAQALHDQLNSVRHELKELTSLTGKNREAVTALLDKVQADKKAYEQSVDAFTVTRGVVSQQGRILMAEFGPDRLEWILEKSCEEIEGSWTTGGLVRSMQSLFGQTTRQFEKIHQIGIRIKGLVDAAYKRFHEQHDFEEISPPALNLDPYRLSLFELTQKTEEFCRDPVNLMTEKHFLIKKFHIGLVVQARQVFEQARTESEAWLRASLSPLMTQIREHKTQIDRRLENVRQIHDNIDTLEERVRELVKTQARLQQHSATIEQIRTKLR